MSTLGKSSEEPLARQFRASLSKLVYGRLEDYDSSPFSKWLVRPKSGGFRPGDLLPDKQELPPVPKIVFKLTSAKVSSFKSFSLSFILFLTTHLAPRLVRARRLRRPGLPLFRSRRRDHRKRKGNARPCLRPRVSFILVFHSLFLI